MKKVCFLILISMAVSICTSACNIQSQAPLIKSQRRFAKYVQPHETSHSGVVDLSEGPKLKYDANFGPRSLNFDITIKNPYW